MAPSNKNNKRQAAQPKTKRYTYRRPNHVVKTSRKTDNRHVGCGICKEDHRIVSCKKFANLNIEQKYKTVQQLHYCSNCLARSHLLDKCTNKARCRVCGLKHHTVLHGHKKILKNLKTNDRGQIKDKPLPHQPSNTTRTIGLPSSVNRVFVPTAEVYVMTEDGYVIVRAIMNPSSTSSRVASSFIRKNKLPTFDLDVKLTRN